MIDRIIVLLMLALSAVVAFVLLPRLAGVRRRRNGEPEESGRGSDEIAFPPALRQRVSPAKREPAQYVRRVVQDHAPAPAPATSGTTAPGAPPLGSRGAPSARSRIEGLPRLQRAVVWAEVLGRRVL